MLEDVVTGLTIWGAAESAVTIMAASIPVLRTLFHDLRVSGRRGYYGSQIVEDSSVSSRFGRDETSVRVVTVDGFHEHSTVRFGHAGHDKELELETVLVRRPEPVYGVTEFPDREQRETRRYV
jgi:hypothetical protein